MSIAATSFAAFLLHAARYVNTVDTRLRHYRRHGKILTTEYKLYYGLSQRYYPATACSNLVWVGFGGGGGKLQFRPDSYTVALLVSSRKDLYL